MKGAPNGKIAFALILLPPSDLPPSARPSPSPRRSGPTSFITAQTDGLEGGDRELEEADRKLGENRVKPQGVHARGAYAWYVHSIDR